MALTFLVETGTGLVADTTSYVSIAEADDYMSAVVQNTAWDALLDADKELRLMQATRVLDVFTRYNGNKSVNASPLRWPRCGILDRDEIAVDSDIIPEGVKNATIELANLLISVDLNAEASTKGIQKIVADVVEIEFLHGSDGQGVEKRKFPSIINAHLIGLGFFSLRVSGGGKIRRA